MFEEREAILTIFDETLRARAADLFEEGAGALTLAPPRPCRWDGF